MSELNADRIVELAAELEPRLGRQIAFLVELDRLKTVMRQSLLADSSRYENTAEHSWHLAMMALVLGDRAHPDVDVMRALKAVLIHDIVEIDAGDTYIYATDGHGDTSSREAVEDKAAREAAAADRIFGLLPPDQEAEVRALWEEYEARDTPTGRFAYAIDRLQPLLLNGASSGLSWQRNGIAHHRVRAVNSPIAEADEGLWALATAIIDEAVAIGALLAD